MKVRFPIIGQVLTGKDTKTEAPVKQKFIDVLGGFFDFSTQKLSTEKTVSPKLLEANTGWVYRNNDAIAQAVSKIEFELYTVGLSNGEIVYNEVNSHPLLDLLDKPNDESTSTSAIYLIQSHRKLTGDAFWVKNRTNGQITSLRTLPPDKVELILRSPTEKDPTVIEKYWYKDTIDGKKVDVKYDPKDIIHFKKPNPKNPFRGLGAVEALSETIDLDNLTTQVMLNYLKNGAIQNFALTTDVKINDDQLKRLKGEMRAGMSGTRNAFNVPIFGSGLKPVDISYSNKEQQLIDQLDWYKEKIMYGFGNTKASLGMIDDVNRASHEGSIIEWQRDTVKPDMQAIVDTLNEFLVPEFGDNLVLGYCDPVPEDNSDDVAEAQTLFQASIITRNEARDMVGLDPTENDVVGEVFLLPMGITEEPQDGLPNQGQPDESKIAEDVSNEN